MTYTQLIIEDALLNELTNQRRLYSAAVAQNNDSEAQKIWDRIQELRAQIKNIKEDRTMKKLEDMTSKELKEIAKVLKVPNWWNINKAALIGAIKEKQTKTEEVSKATRRKRVVQTHSEAPKTQSEEVSEKPKQNVKAEPKKPNKKLTELTYKGETKSIREWAAELEMPWPTLYDRVNRNGWTVEDAIETPLGQRRPR